MNRYAVVFSGQGSQYKGMGKRLYEKYDLVKHIFNEASDILKVDVKKLCFEGDIDLITQTEIAQPLILTIGVANFKLFMEKNNIEPSYLVGHSLGEITALVCADSISFDIALPMVQARGRFMQEAVENTSGAMSAIIGVSENEIQEECEKYNEGEHIVSISNYNSCSQFVISGHKSAVDSVHNVMKNNGATCKRLNVSAPFHCLLMQSVAEKFGEYIKNIEFKDPRYSVISTVTGIPFSSKELIVDYLKYQITSPVQWVKSMNYLKCDEIDTIINMGPGDVTLNLSKQFGFNKYYTMENEEELITNSENKKINKIGFIEACVKTVVCCPNLEGSFYSKDYINKIQKIKSVLYQARSEKIEVSDSDINVAKEIMLKLQAFKKISEIELNSRFEKIYLETGIRLN